VPKVWPKKVQNLLVSVEVEMEVLKRWGARISFGHDPEFWRSVPQAPASIA